MNVQQASDYINKNDYVSLIEVCGVAGIDRQGGGFAVGWSAANIYFAVDCSVALTRLLYELARLGHGLSPTSIMTVMIDGEPIPRGMKVVGKRPPTGGYKTPRYLPVLLRKQGVAEAVQLEIGDYENVEDFLKKTRGEPLDL